MIIRYNVNIEEIDEKKVEIFVEDGGFFEVNYVLSYWLVMIWVETN